jgi:hypothetical protein
VPFWGCRRFRLLKLQLSHRPPAIKGSSLIEPVACRTVRQRVVRPNGSVVYRVKRRCGLAQVRPGRHCTVVKERIRRANGSVVFRSIRRCN